MRSARKTSVQTQLAVVVLIAIALSWVLSTAVTNYLAYREVLSLRQVMLANPQRYPYPIPEPRFGIGSLFTGPRSFFDGPPPPRPGSNGPPGAPPGPRERPKPPPSPVRDVALRIAIALGLALAAGSWLSWRFTRPLAELAEGARSLSAGDLGTRFAEQSSSEIEDVATAMNEMAERVEGQIAELREEAARRRHLLADVAHELRGPVTTLRTMAGALADGVAADPDRIAQAQDAMVRASERLLRLVNDLLALARLDLRELPLQMREVDIRALARSSVRAREPEAREAGVTLTAPPDGPPILAIADPERVAQVFDNLIVNSISYAGAGASCRVEVEAGEQVRIVVADTGLGIPEKHLPFVFDPFYRADPARTPADNHSGLGLRIARGLVEAHGGKLVLESSEGRGTRVTLTIPSAATASPSAC